MKSWSKRPEIILSAEEAETLQSISNSRSRPKREVERAAILLAWEKKTPIAAIAKTVKVNKETVYRCIDKAICMGVMAGLKDRSHSPKKPEITLAAKSWVVNLACTQPKDLGLAAELWSMQSLATEVRKRAIEAGHSCLGKAAKATVHRILKEPKLKPHKIKYYLERRDPDFENKMREVLIVYEEVGLQNEAKLSGDSRVITVCIDEKPGVQAIANTSKDLPPVPDKHPSICRDHEYKRHGTASILAGIDLSDGHVFARVERRHRSIEFIGLLKEIDSHYPKGKQIRVILDNHSAHTSKETLAFLATKPNRFVYVHTPTHGSWLNLAETLFGKMARTFLKSIRVASWQELKERILKGVAEINQAPVVHQWSKFDALHFEKAVGF